MGSLNSELNVQPHYCSLSKIIKSTKIFHETGCVSLRCYVVLTFKFKMLIFRPQKYCYQLCYACIFLQYMQCITLPILSYISNGNWASQSFRNAYIGHFYVQLALALSLMPSPALSQGYCLAPYEGQGRQMVEQLPLQLV